MWCTTSAPKVLGVQQHVAHHACVGDARLAVGESDGTGALQEADLGHLLAFEATGSGGHDVHVDDGAFARTPLHVVDERHLVDDGFGVGHAHDGRDAAGGGGKACGLQRLTMLLTRIAREDLAIDEPWRQHMALAIDYRSALRRVAAQVRS